MAASVAARMTAALGTTPEPCDNCGRNVWANDEIGCA